MVLQETLLELQNFKFLKMGENLRGGFSQSWSHITHSISVLGQHTLRNLGRTDYRYCNQSMTLSGHFAIDL